MIGIVIVSHSAKLAEGVVELACSMGGADVRIRAAGGMNLPGQPLGTDPLFILNAIEEVYSDDGVLVLMDLGSALLSAEMAVEMLPETKREHVVLCEAPIVEGAVVAAVQARIGSPLKQVIAEARRALAVKAEQLTPPVQEAELQPEKDHDPVERQDTIILAVNHVLGLHARPASILVKTAGRFKQTEIKVKNLSTVSSPVNARSINAVMALGVLQGHEILVSATGPEAKAALAAIQELVESNFGDDERGGNPVIQA